MRVVVLYCAILLLLGGAVRASDDGSIPKEWLQKQITVAEAEALHPGIRDERVRRVPEAAKPFGFMNQQWEALKAEMKPGDEIWSFSSPAQTWEDLAGRAGVVLIRDGKVVKMLVTAMN
jgi:hypothetical protein